MLLVMQGWSSPEGMNTFDFFLTFRTGLSKKKSSTLLGDRLTAGQQTLTLLIGVRIPVSQPFLNLHLSHLQQLSALYLIGN